jgi:hypothetical protein
MRWPWRLPLVLQSETELRDTQHVQLQGDLCDRVSEKRDFNNYNEILHEDYLTREVYDLENYL